MKFALIPLIFFALFSQLTFAKRFRNAYVSFELPPNWNCNLENTEWVCINQFSQKTKEAMIILTAKQVGPEDNLPAYRTFLKNSHRVVTDTGRSFDSKVIQSQDRIIAGHPWVDGLQLNGEIEGYYSRYLATSKDNVAILVSFTAHKAHYTKYSGDFLSTIESLRVVASKDGLDEKGGAGVPRAGVETIGRPIGPIPEPLTSADVPEEPTGGASGKAGKILGLALLLAVGAGYFYLYKRRRQRPKK